MDADHFSHATRLGRNAACALIDAARGAPFDPFYTARMFDALIERAGGIPSLRVVLTELADLRSPALLISPDAEEIWTRMERAAHEPSFSWLDLVHLCRVTRFEDLLALDPDIRSALDPPTGPLTPDAAKAELVGMYRRYAGKIRAFLGLARPMLQSAPSTPRAKEMAHDLFPATR